MGTHVETRGGPLRICVVAACQFPHSRGSPIRIQRLANALVKRGHSVRVVTYHLGKSSPDDQFEITRSANVPTYKKLSPGPSVQKLLVVDPLLTAKLASTLRNESFDIIHAHHYEGLLTAKVANIGRGIPIVYDAHTLLGSELPYYKMGAPRGVVAGLGDRLDRWLPGLSDHIVTVTQTIKDKLAAQGMSEDDISVITNGVEYELFTPAVEGRNSSSIVPRLVFTGNFASYQGIDNLLKSFAKVVRQREGIRLLLVARSSFEPYETLAQELGVREFIDFSEAPFAEHPRLLAESAIAVNPRIDADGIPQKLLNYMASSCPTVSFRGSAPFIDHGKTGWTVENGNIDAFADGILKLLDEPQLADELGRNAREAVLANYTWDIAAERCESLYRRLLGQEPICGPDHHLSGAA